MHIVSDLLLLKTFAQRLSSIQGWEKVTPDRSGGIVLFLQGAEVGVAPVLWVSWSPATASVSSDKFRAVVLFDRRPIISWVGADPFGRSLLSSKCQKGKGTMK